MTKRNRILTLVFLLIVLVELTGRFIDNIYLEYPVKPLIMIWITVYFLLNRQKSNLLWLVISAFFFSWVGDILLMFSGGYDNEMFFYAGVGGFFFAQVSYILLFLLNKENDIKGLILRNPLWLIPLLGFGVFVYWLLYPSLEGMMKVIILIYAIALVGMSIAALNRRDRVGKMSFRFVFIGSLFFLISDSLIAVNKFHAEIPLAGFIIMSTYILAQYLIMRGLILEKPKDREV